MKLRSIFSPKPTFGAKEERELHLKVYEAALAEYRFNVNLTWDRTKFYLTLSVTAIAAGIALFHFAEGSIVISLFLSLYFILLVFLSSLGLDTVKTGKAYSREAIFTKTLIEKELGLLRVRSNERDKRVHFSIAVTPGMLDHEAVLSQHSERMAKEIGRRSILGRMNRTFAVIIIIELAGVVVPWIDIVVALNKGSQPAGSASQASLPGAMARSGQDVGASQTRDQRPPVDSRLSQKPLPPIARPSRP